MSYVCPVCNGLEALQPICPDCGQAAADQGKLSDFYGPYSPYRPIDDLKMTNGYDDLRRHVCMHSVYCSRCGRSFELAVGERPE
ncbi:hypothetical protein [Paenibacillus hamazuiensis]|uniref:hypothetical protein n=1 Tax=Paenibacillus hamazuiensis TaxID=2936508 RepID=UPI00200DFD24|nr:hypothetical protein [Paenibacillus hamazuiensis]